MIWGRPVRPGQLDIFVNLNRLELSNRFQILHADSYKSQVRLKLSYSTEFLNTDSYYNMVQCYKRSIFNQVLKMYVCPHVIKQFCNKFTYNYLDPPTLFVC